MNNFAVYLVTNQGVVRGRNLSALVSLAIAGGVTCVQVRVKGDDDASRQIRRLEASSLLPVTRLLDVPLIINDDVELAVELGADGAHVGQSDLSARDARRMLGSTRILGVSAYTPEEAIAAQAAGADYVGVGPVFATKTKTDALPPMGVCRFSEIARSVRIPVVAIGGITVATAQRVVSAGADGVAVISGILAQEDVTAAAVALSSLIRTESRTHASVA